MIHFYIFIGAFLVSTGRNPPTTPWSPLLETYFHASDHTFKPESVLGPLNNRLIRLYLPPEPWTQLQSLLTYHPPTRLPPLPSLIGNHLSLSLPRLHRLDPGRHPTSLLLLHCRPISLHKLLDDEAFRSSTDLAIQLSQGHGSKRTCAFSTRHCARARKSRTCSRVKPGQTRDCLDIASRNKVAASAR